MSWLDAMLLFQRDSGAGYSCCPALVAVHIQPVGDHPDLWVPLLVLHADQYSRREVVESL